MRYEWAIIGAGPAGITAVGKLIDHGIDPKKILWIDPEFKVGDLGTKWRNVSSNTKVNLFLKFLYGCKAFSYQHCDEDFPINHEDPEATCLLKLIAAPLRWISNQLQKRVTCVTGIAEKIYLKEFHWHIQVKNKILQTKNIILAVGSEPINLNYSTELMKIEDAIDFEKIKNHVNEDDVVAVFGSSHSAIIVLKNLVDIPVKKIINFYRSPLRYAVYFEDWILFDDSGLKGASAKWARDYVDGNMPANLERIYSNTENIEHHLPRCNKVVYAIGFARRHLPINENIGKLEYAEECGIISPGLFGFGIAFPEAKYNPIGIREFRVGLWKFMEYIDKILPIWLKYSV